MSAHGGIAVHGRDVATDSYKVSTRIGGRIAHARVPECLMAGLRPGDRPTHQEAYEWIAAHAPALVDAIDRLTRGRTPRRPYDIVTLKEGAP